MSGRTLRCGLTLSDGGGHYFVFLAIAISYAICMGVLGKSNTGWDMGWGRAVHVWGVRGSEIHLVVSHSSWVFGGS